MTHVSRRHLAKGAAWTIPAVAIAASAPSLAASPSNGPGEGTPGDGGSQPPVVVEGSSFAEKCQGNAEVPGGWPKQGYRMELTVSSPDAPAPKVLSVVLGNGSTGTVLDVGPVQLRPGVWEYVVQAASSPSSLTITYTIGDGTTQSATIPASPHCNG
ncbi:hypothetical protein ASG73_16495 [Janibacter sp. Soil728]|uniref:hypothetical protein n=1 Tax=Janibacter sp. Soil728 TaxID=1736393 RepID=UPI0006F44986|nr:hypothetical protein [Janibacter sp. Soil728]KRE35531.1 hypothetical protein ASG73_16495 [Janibacter sp. Soil728]